MYLALNSGKAHEIADMVVNTVPSDIQTEKRALLDVLQIVTDDARRGQTVAELSRGRFLEH